MEGQLGVVMINAGFEAKVNFVDKFSTLNGTLLTKIFYFKVISITSKSWETVASAVSTNILVLTAK